MRFLATTTENSAVLSIPETQPYFTYGRRFFLHRENTAERTTSTAGQSAESTVVHGHSPLQVPVVSQLETVVHGHSPPPLPPVSQLETVVNGHRPPPAAPVSQMDTVVHGHSPPPVSYTHLTLPTILRV